MSREELIFLIREIRGFQGRDEDHNRLMDNLTDNVEYPTPIDLIFNHPIDLTVEEIAEIIASYG